MAETLLGGEFGYLILENIFLTDSVINVGPKSNLGLLIFLAVLLTMSQSSWSMSDNINNFKHPLGLIHHVWTCNPILNGALVLLSRRVSVSAGSNQDAQSYFRKLNSDWIFFMKSVKTDLDVVGMMKISAWLQEMLGIQPQIRRPWLELNFRNWNKPGALSRGRPLRNGYKEVEIVHLRSGDGTAVLIKRYTECLARPSVLELQLEGYV